VYERLKLRDLLPSEHAVDSGYTSAEHILTARSEYGLELLGPLHGNTTWQTHNPDTFDLRHFTIDWDNQHVPAPTEPSAAAGVRRRTGKPVLELNFRKTDCTPCPLHLVNGQRT